MKNEKIAYAVIQNQCTFEITFLEKVMNVFLKKCS